MRVRYLESLGAAVGRLKGQFGPHAREITSIATHSNGIALELQKFQCDGTHGHVPTDRERVKQRQVYPEALCEAICVTTAKERHAAKPEKDIFGLASTQCVDVSLHVKQLIASVSEAANEGPHDAASLYDDFDYFFL